MPYAQIFMSLIGVYITLEMATDGVFWSPCCHFTKLKLKLLVDIDLLAD